MWNIKCFYAFLAIVNIKCSMIVGNYREWLDKSICNQRQTCWNLDVFYFLAVPETRPPREHDLSNNFWHELSSPNNESSDENMGETTTHVHEPFFEENSTQINSTTQLGSDVYLHCRVNDLREKMVSKVLLKVLSQSYGKSKHGKSFRSAINTPKVCLLSIPRAQCGTESYNSMKRSFMRKQ